MSIRQVRRFDLPREVYLVIENANGITANDDTRRPPTCDGLKL